MTDWKALISDLEDAGLTRAEIAGAVDAAVTTVNDLAQGRSKSPRFGTGVALLQLYVKHVRPEPRKRARAA
jgi:hypothetical protein